MAGFWSDDAMAEQPSDDERKLRDLFVNEYMVDFDQRAAAIRIGFSVSFAPEYAQRFMDEPYVRQQIALRQKIAADDPKTEEAETKRRIRAALLREAHYHGPGSSHAARVSALAKLGAMYGMDAPILTKQEIMHRGGVIQVPEIASLDKWEEAAIESQKALQKASSV